MSDYDMSIHSNPDAAAWAAFFTRTFPPGSPCPDGATMLGWFANAMMAQHDFDARRAAPASPAPSEEAHEACDPRCVLAKGHAPPCLDSFRRRLPGAPSSEAGTRGEGER